MLLSALPLLLAPVPLRSQSGDGAAQYFRIRTIDSLVQAQQYDAALALLTVATEVDPRNMELFVLAGHVARTAGRCREAVRAYTGAWSLGVVAPDYIAYSIARCQARLGDRQQTIAWLDSALAYRFTPRTALATDPNFAFLQQDTALARIAGRPVGPPLGRDDGWRWDIRLFATEAQRLHASWRREAFSVPFTSGVQALLDAVPRRTDEQLLVELRRLVTLLHDGHSYVWQPEARQRRLAVDLYDFDDGVFVTGGEAAASPWVGARVTAIGGIVMDTLRARLADFQKHDNALTLRQNFPFYLTLPELLRRIGAMGPGDSARFTLVDRTGGVHAVAVPAGPARFGVPFLTPAAGVAAPDWLARDANYWFEPRPGLHAVYWQMNHVWPDQRWPLPAMLDSLDHTLAATDARYLMLDLRRNDGGNARLSGEIVRRLARFELADSSHRVFVLISRHTFSAAQILLAQIRRFTHAVLAGGPSGSRPNFTGEGGDMIELPHSGLRVNISTRYHQEAPFEDLREWIPVEIPVPYRSTDHFGGRDPVMEQLGVVIRDLEARRSLRHPGT